MFGQPKPFTSEERASAAKAEEDLKAMHESKRYRTRYQLPAMRGVTWTLTLDFKWSQPSYSRKEDRSLKVQLVFTENLDEKPEIDFFGEQGWSDYATSFMPVHENKKWIASYRHYEVPYIAVKVKSFLGKWFISVHTPESGYRKDRWTLVGSQQTFTQVIKPMAAPRDPVETKKKVVRKRARKESSTTAKALREKREAERTAEQKKAWDDLIASRKQTKRVKVEQEMDSQLQNPDPSPKYPDPLEQQTVIVIDDNE